MIHPRGAVPAGGLMPGKAAARAFFEGGGAVRVNDDGCHSSGDAEHVKRQAGQSHVV